MKRIWLSSSLIFFAAVLAVAGTIGPDTEEALARALEDERASAALYEAVIAEQGEVLPFANIVHAEVRHADHLLALFDQFGIEAPENAWVGRELEVPASRSDACRLAIEAEVRNVAMYDALLESVEQPEVREIFTILRDASRDRHIPAFERCVSSGGGRGRGGCGRGQGAGRGGPGPHASGNCPGCCAKSSGGNAS
jgi:rubrerythrin